jgi:hypothetical protein
MPERQLIVEGRRQRINDKTRVKCSSMLVALQLLPNTNMYSMDVPSWGRK